MNKKMEQERKEGLWEGYIGTYYSRESRGIYRFFFDEKEGEITEPELFYEARNAKWICANGTSLVFPVEKKEGAGTCFLEVKDGKVIGEEEILEERQTPCYILQNGNRVYTANYHEGNVMVYHLEQGKPSLIKRIENGEKAGCHQILLHENYLLVPCLEQNRIRLFDTENEYCLAGDILFPEGSGPRHGVFNREHTKLYVVSEWSNRLFVFRVHEGEFVPEETHSVLPEGWMGKEEAAAAAIRLTRDERHLYISVRGANLLSVFDISGDRVLAIQHVSCGGSHPRDFILTGDETCLLVANRFQGGIVGIERDRESGLLGGWKNLASMPEGVALTLRDRTEETL